MSPARTLLSCCIITKNEGDRIERCILAARDIVDEIVVVDSGSSDDTVAKAEALGAKIFHRAWDGYGPQKRFAEDCAGHDWILNLDADEVLSEALAREIAALMRAGPARAGYRFRQVTVYPDRPRPRLFADAHNYIRLYDRRLMRFAESRVHDTVDPGPHEIGRLKGAALHFSWRSLAHLGEKLDSYTDQQARELKKSRAFVRLRAPFEYPLQFLRYYFLRAHVTGGAYGVKVAHVIAAARARRVRKFL
ncbi:MAG: glycosyltransferase family 2 protein [Amphiplicatus sp.]